MLLDDLLASLPPVSEPEPFEAEHVDPNDLVYEPLDEPLPDDW